MANSIYTSNESLGIILDDISNDVIVIDTSDNRIGVNIMEPHYSIDVRDFSDASGIIYTDYLKTGAIISDLTPDIDVCYNLGTQDKKWNEIHANYLEVSGIKIKDASQFILGSGTGGDAIVFPSDISVNGDISCVNLNVDGITIKDASKFTIGSGTSDTNGIEFMANTTISGDLTITGNINSSYINSLLSGSNDINGYAENVVTDISRGNVFSKYSGTQLLSDFSNQDVGIAATEMVDYFIEVRNNKYFINGLEAPQLELRKNTTYKFNHIPGIISVIPGVTHGNDLYGEGLVYYFTDSSGHYIYVFDSLEFKTWYGVMVDGSIKYDPFNKRWELNAIINPTYIEGATGLNFDNGEIKYSVNGTDTTFIDPYYEYYNEHPFRFYTDSDHTTIYDTGVIYDGSMITITTGSDDITLYYDCSFNHEIGSDAPIILKEKEDYKNFNIKVVDESSLLTYTLDEYNQYDLGDSNVFRLVDSTDSFGISNTGIIVEKTDANYKIETDVCFNITNYNDFDLCLNVILTKNNVVLNSAFYNVNSNSDNNIQYNTLERLNLLQNDVLNVKYLLYHKRYNAVTINDLDSLEYSNDSLLNFSYTSPVFTRYHGTNRNDPTVEHPFKDSNDNIYNWYGQFIGGGSFTYDNIFDENELESDISKSILDTRPNVNDYSNNDIFKYSNNIKLNNVKYGIDQYYTLSGEKLIVNTDIQLDTYINIEYRHENHWISRADYISNADEDKVKLHQIVFVVKKSGDEETIIDYIKYMHSKNRIHGTTDHTVETIINNYNIFPNWLGDDNNPLYTQYGHPWTLPFRFNLKDYSLKSGDEITFKSILVFYYFNANYTDNGTNSFFGLNLLHLDQSQGPQGPQTGHNNMYYRGTVEYSVNIEIPPQTNKVYTNEIDVNLRSFNINVEKSLDPPPDFNYNITVMNNSVLNNQDIYSKYKGTNVLTDFSNQNVGYNPDYNKTFTVVTMGSSYQQDQNWVTSVSSQISGNEKHNMMDGDSSSRWQASSPGPESVTFNLGGTKSVIGLRIITTPWRFLHFTLQKSSNGSDFTTIQDFSDFGGGGTSGGNNVSFTFNLYSIHHSQYFRLFDIYGDGGDPGITEISFNILDSTGTTDVSYIINDEIQPDLSLYIDTPYIFDLTNVSASHPFNIYTDVNSQSLYTGAVIDGSFIYLTIDSATTALYYNCSNHTDMGGVIDIINTSNYHNFNVKFIGDTNNIVRSDLLEYNRFDLTSSKFNRNSTSGYANSVDLSGVKVGLYGEYYDIDASLNLSVTNTSVYDISLDFVLLQNSVVLYSQTINVDISTTSQDILINPQLSRLTMFQDDTVNFAFLPYIKSSDGISYSVNDASAASYQPIDLDINVNSFNLVVSAPDYEELEVGNLLTANNIDVSNIDVSNIDIKNTLTIASETPTNGGDSLVFDGNKLTWKNAIIDVREYITDVDIILTKIATFENEYSYTKYGRSVAMTPDGKYICITSELGSINVFEIINNNSYQQIGNSIDISNGSYTHINEDGTVIAIGKLNNIVRVYNFVDNVWQQLGEDITPSNWNNQDTYFVIQLSANGDQIYIGDSTRNSNIGIVYIYDFSMQTQNWVLNTTIVPNSSTSDRFGSDIKLSGVMDNGKLRLLVGAKAYNNGTNQGFIKLFESTNGGKTWPNYSSHTTYIQSNSNNDNFGQSIAISRNGKVIMSGFREINSNSGKGSLGIYHEDNINGPWSPVYFRESSGGSNLSQQANQAFGSSAMALNYDGSRIFCSNYYYNSNDLTNNGIVLIFNYDYLNNNTITFVTSYSGTTTNEQLAFVSGNLSCNDSGDRFIVSAYQYSNDAGRAHLFNVTNDSLGSIPVGSIYYQSSGNDAYVLKIKA